MPRLALIFALSSLAPLAAAQPPEGAWLRYRYEQRLLDGTGRYDGYTEVTVAHARYQVVSASTAAATIHARYAWTYASPERRDSGVENRVVSFAVPSRRYLERRTDVSDYDHLDGRSLATWVWIPPDASPASPVAILEHDFHVTATGIPVEIAGAPRRAIVLVSETRGRRDDAYGSFDTSITDRYWYDAATGMFLREVHEERAVGTLEGDPAGFTLRTTIEVIDSSYAPAPSPPPEDDYTRPPVAPFVPMPPVPRSASASASGWSGLECWLILAALGLGTVATVFVVRAARRRSRAPTQTAGGERFAVREPKGALPPLSGLSPLFDPFVPHLVAVARATKQPVAIATGASGAVLGVGIGDRQAAVGTIFAKDSDVCEALRLAIGESEFFSELRHPALASVTKLGLSAPPEAYNVYETFELMELTARPDELGYDTEVVSRMREEHEAEVAALLEAVYGVPARAWLRASIEAGDVGWVAEEGGRIIGAAMATIAPKRARLHTLTVHADQRNRGIGTALYRARLRALFDLGVEHVLTEVATWNVGALELARAHGFTKAGVMYVESARSHRHPRKFVRR